MQSILGISLGRQSTGIALVSYGTLIKWNVHSFNQQKGKSKDKAIIQVIDELITKNGVTHVAIKLPSEFERHAELTRLVGMINVLLESKKIKASFYSLGEIKHLYAAGERINKRMLMKLVLKKHHVLTSRYNIEVLRNRSYYIKVFEAVAAAHVSEMDK
jgi:RNase H-fold protein (predicted Holliday junction resolvase)